MGGGEDNKRARVGANIQTETSRRPPGSVWLGQGSLRTVPRYPSSWECSVGNQDPPVPGGYGGPARLTCPRRARQTPAGPA